MEKFKGFKNNNGQFNENDRRWSIILGKAIQRKRLTKAKILIKNWIPHFKKLRAVDGIESARIETVLKWYINHLRDKYTPRAYSAKSFRQKFLDIEDAMERDKKQLDLFEDDFDVTVIQNDENGFEFVIHYDDIEDEELE